MAALSEVVERAVAVVAELGAVLSAELSTLPGEELDALLPRVGALSDGVASVRTVVVGEWESRGRFRLDGSRSASARLARDSGCSPAAAGVVSRRGRFLRRFPVVAEAFARGELSADKVDVLARAAIPVRHGLFEDAVEDLLSDAKRLSCADLARVVTYWADVADEHLGRDRSKGEFEGRRLSVSRTSGGATLLEGRLDVIGGAIVTAELDRICQELFEDDWAVARAEYGEGATADRLVRSATQRRADALRIMATRSAAMPEGARVGRPLVVIHCDEETGRRFAVLEDGTAVAPGAMVPWWTQADFERVVHEPPGRIIDVGRRTRFFRGGLRRAIEARDRHCTFPGCTVPASQCDVDHIIEYSQGGLTTQANGRLRCPTHNRQRPGRRPPRDGPSGGPPEDRPPDDHGPADGRSDDRPTDDRPTDDRSPDGRSSEDRSPDGCSPDGCSPDGRSPDGGWPEVDPPDGPVPGGEPPSDRPPDGADAPARTAAEPRGGRGTRWTQPPERGVYPDAPRQPDPPAPP